ncbi:MAG TPA: protein kinase [Gemmatimonadaceae bacterium]|nr:protein kinase [Gemmatimonadaceae bacterium]
MSQLSDQLQVALDASYRIERELGGGMSRVFVAEDLRLGRKVVLKVLPPEFAGGVNVERFEREIRLAARLQHPHIVPLLAAGSVGDLPYYVMPYIDGESLRTRLSRDGELPLAEAVKLLGEVIDALDYAHRHGVVHRDIKPDNILLTEHHAVVTDFGVAKAVSDATGDVHLTATGVALGTPAYMAPEQIAGEPNVDHRADIYATGSLAFEMVTGLQPFRGATTQAILAAHMTQAPPSLATLRQGIPAALDAIVLRCLEKRPADRWQTAAEILPLLDAVGAAPGATAPSNRAVSTPRLAATNAAHPIRIAAVFALVSVAVLAAVWWLVQFVGLPDWVFQGAIALLAVGLPIVLFTNRRDRQRAVGNMAGPVGIQRLFTSRRSIQGGILAFAGLGLAAAGFTASRALGIGPGATLLSAGVLAPRERIIIADFDNRTTDSTLGPTVAQLMRIDLAQSPSIAVMEPRQVSDVLARMQRDRSTDVTSDVAREVAAREGMKAYLTGEIIPAGKGFVIAMRLVSPSSGDALVSLRRNVRSPDDLMDAVDRLSSKLRAAVGESLRSVRADPPLEQVTTSSLTALRLYAEGTRAADHAGYDHAISLLEQAVAADSGFAMAWRRLGIYATNAGQGPLMRAKGDSALRRAYALRHGLPERERLFVEASVAMDQDLERAAAAYLSILDKYPQDATALNNLGAIYERLGRRADALDSYRRAIATRMAPSLTYANAIVLAGGHGELDVADSLFRQFARDFPASSDLSAAAINLADFRQDFRAVDSLARVLVRGSPIERAAGYQYLTMLAELGGRMGDAAREQRNALRVDEARGQISPAEAKMVAEFTDITRAADYATESKQLARRLDALWDQNRGFTAARRPILRRHRDFAAVFARLGDTARAQALMNEFTGVMTERDYPAAGARVRTYLVLAAVATAAGRPDDALAQVREGCGLMPGSYLACDQMAFLEVAEAHDRAGRADSAIAGYRRFVGLHGLRMFAPSRSIDVVTPKIAPAWRRLGELLEAKGEKQQAIEAYEHFIALWRDADPDLQPIVRAVSEHVVRLRRASG